jgi:two-component system, OmpR family, sensor histidine kinase CpxA
VADNMVKRYETEGAEGAIQEIKARSDGERINMWLLDASGNDVAGKQVPADVMQAAKNTKSTPETTVRVEDKLSFLSVHYVGQRGIYTLVARYATVPLLRGQGLIRLFVISVILASITCLILAHYLSQPIWRLRLATHRLAKGDLDARAGEDLGKRSDEIADLVRDFDTMADRIRELLENQKRLLSDVSHELRSPLARLRVALALARRHENEGQVAVHQRMEREIERLDEMIGRILTLSRLESGQVELTRTKLDLNELIEHVLDDARFEAERTGHSIAFKADVQVQIDANEELLRSSIENVVRNALYYTSDREPIQVELSTQGDQAIIRVRDSGPGVAAEALDKLFRPFYRVDDSRMSATGGAGLGLAIAQRAILAHGGTIVARNASPHGLIVEIAIPGAVAQVPTPV